MPDIFQAQLRKPEPADSHAFRLSAAKRTGAVKKAARLFMAVFTVSIMISGALLEVEARSSKRASSGKSRHASGRSSSSSRSSRARSSRVSRSQRSARGSRSRGSRSAGRSGSRGRARAVAPQHHGPTASQIRRQETSGANDLEKRSDLERAYRAYDQGLSEWLSGNYAQAAKYLNESYELYSDFHGSHDVLDSLYLYDLGQAAEAAGDIELAINSYQRSLRRRPDFSDCCIRLTALLTKSGQTALALVYARRLADKTPQDPRAQFLLATMLDKAGFPEEGKAARENFNLIMRGGKVAKPQNQVEQGDRDAAGRPSEQSSDGTKEEKGESKDKDDKVEKVEKVEKDETDTESGAGKNTSSTDKQDSGSVKKPDSESQNK